MLALAIQAATPVPAPESDIVVIGRKARNWRGTFQASSKGVSRECKTKRSTGDLEIDAIGCQATVACYTESHPKMAETKSRKEANARMNALMQAEMLPCMNRAYEPLVAALAASRRGAGVNK